MGVDVAYLRESESIGIAVGNFANEMTALYVSQPGLAQFSDEAVSNGLGPFTRLDLTFGTFFFDADLDGRLDLLAANGHLRENIQRVQPSQSCQQPARLFWNAGPEEATEFVPLTAKELNEDFVKPMVGRGASYADIDGDGDLDVLLMATGAPCRLLRNDQSSDHHWIRLKLKGKTSNRDAIGATVTLVTESGTQTRTVMPTCSYLSQVELPLTFGLGSDDVIRSAVVQWPSGESATLDGLAIDQLHIIEEQPTAE